MRVRSTKTVRKTFMDPQKEGPYTWIQTRHHSRGEDPFATQTSKDPFRINANRDPFRHMLIEVTASRLGSGRYMDV